jgi:hypothetical protein
MSPRRTPAATTATGKPTRARPSRSRSVMSNLHSIVPCEQSHRRLEVGPDLPVAGLAPGRGRSRDRTMAAPPGRGNPTTTRRRQGTGQLPRGRKTSRRRVTLGQVSGAWAGRPAHGIPCFSLRRPSCAARLTPGGYCYCSRAPLGAASRLREAPLSSPVESFPSNTSWICVGPRRCAKPIASPYFLSTPLPGTRQGRCPPGGSFLARAAAALTSRVFACTCGMSPDTRRP